MNRKDDIEQMLREDPVGVSEILRDLQALQPLEEELFKAVKALGVADTGELVKFLGDRHGRTVVATRLKRLFDRGVLERLPNPEKPVGFLYTIPQPKGDNHDAGS